MHRLKSRAAGTSGGQGSGSGGEGERKPWELLWTFSTESPQSVLYQRAAAGSSLSVYPPWHLCSSAGSHAALSHACLYPSLHWAKLDGEFCPQVTKRDIYNLPSLSAISFFFLKSSHGIASFWSFSASVCSLNLVSSALKAWLTVAFSVFCTVKDLIQHLVPFVVFHSGVLWHFMDGELTTLHTLHSPEASLCRLKIEKWGQKTS